MPRSPAQTWVFLSAMALLAMGSASAATAGDKPLRETIDAGVRAAWQKEKIVPAGKADDATFLRRVYLDLVGTIPTLDETKRFLADPDPKKREKLIDQLLADPRFGTEQAHVWDLLLFGRNPPGYDATRRREGFKKWLGDQFAKNVPYDQWVRALMLGEEEGTAIYHLMFRGVPEDATVAVTRMFLGTQLQCARCHDHPYEKWTQRDFYGMAGFFVRLVVVDGPGSGAKQKFVLGEKSTGEVLFTGSVKEQKPGQKGEPVRPRFLGGAELDEPAVPKDFKEPKFNGKEPLPKPMFSRKQKLADWLVASDNPYFARAVANRVWAQYMGRGLVDPVDDLGSKPASHPELLDALTREMVQHKFDLKHMIRELVCSETYQLGDTGKVKDALPAWFERARVRPLSAEELMASIRTAVGPDAYALKSVNENVEYFVRYFGEATNGQGEFQSSLAEHLFLNNSGQIRAMAQPRKGNLADTLITSKAPWDEKVDQLFLSVLSRPARSEERERFVKHLSSDAKMTSPLVEDAIWVLLSCSEFRFNR
jgi:Protein of unknown function (DUF1549)/Protein of unknown function (DUF1553)